MLLSYNRYNCLWNEYLILDIYREILMSKSVKFRTY